MNFSQLRNHDWLMTLIIVVLLSLGVITIFSTTLNSVSEAQGAGTLPKQLIFVVVGLIVYFFISTIQISWLQTQFFQVIVYLFIIFSLVLVLLVGQNIAGTNRWIDIGFFSFQPSEYAKIALIIITAGIFTNDDTKLSPNSGIKLTRSKHKQASGIDGKLNWLKYDHAHIWKLIISVLTSIPLIFLTLIQPSLGNAVIISLIWLIIVFSLFPNQKRLMQVIVLLGSFLLIISELFTISRDAYTISMNFTPETIDLFTLAVGISGILIVSFVGRIKIQFLLLLPLISLTLLFATVTVWNTQITNYQKDRIDVFLSGPESDPYDGGYQVRQSKIAIGSGRLMGRGFLEGTQSSLNVLTQSHTDFIFAAMSEQFGFVGSSILLLLYIILIIRILKIGFSSSTSFGRVVALGIATMILLHIFINVGMNLGQLPVTGIPLPLVSYGGNSVLVNLISLGIVQSIAGSKRAVDISDSLMLRSQSRLYQQN